jgi:hypothetical protein
METVLAVLSTNGLISTYLGETEDTLQKTQHTKHKLQKMHFKQHVTLFERFQVTLYSPCLS